MRNFLRSLKCSWSYRYRLAASIACAMAVAVLWSLNLSAIYPVLKILSTDKNLQQWVDDEIEDHQKELVDPQRLRSLEQNRLVLKAIEDNPDFPDRENAKRKATNELSKIESDLSYHRAWIVRYGLLKKHVISHFPQDRFLTFVWIMIGVVVGVAIKGVFEFLQETLVGSVTHRTLFDLRNRIYRRAIHQDVKQLSATGTTEIMARFTNDMEQLGLGIKILYGRMIAEPLKGIGCLVIACCISWQLTLVFIITVPLALGILMKVSKMMRRAARKVLERMSAIYKIVRETFDGIRVVKAFTKEPHERKRFRKTTDEYYRKAMRVIHIDAFASPMIELLGVIAVGLALAAGTYLVVTGQTQIFGLKMASQTLGFATLLQLYAFLAAIADPVRKMSSVYTKLQGAEAAANRVFELYDRMPTIRANGDGPRISGVKKSIEFRNVCFSYNPEADVPTLSNVHLTVKAGETIAIVGQNGCGKTTLLGMVPRFYDPDHGSILIDGVNIRTAHLRHLRKHIGIVTQDTQLFDDTIAANIGYGKKRASLEEIVLAAKKAHAHEFIESLEDKYETRIGDMGGKLSGGQRQRIALARAILRDPSLLILDEFTSAIDPASENEINAALKEFVKGRTTFLITHKLHTLEIADRIAIMDGGKMIDVGTHAELMARCELYQRLQESAQFRKAA